eukprot:scaffold14377_cov74-Cyclotella_meneghiniana.AAC.2
MILSGSPFEELDYSYPEPANKSARFFVDIDLNELRAWGAARPFVAPLMAAEAAAANTMVLLMGSLTWLLLIWVSFSKNPKYKVVGWANGCLHIHLNSPRFSVPAVSDTNIDVVISHTSSSSFQPKRSQKLESLAVVTIIELFYVASKPQAGQYLRLS